MKTGRKTYPHSVSLTLEQIEWLRNFPNSSELVRKLIDDMMAIHGEVEPKLSLLALKREIDVLEKQKSGVQNERDVWLRNLRDWDREKSQWDVMFDPDPDNPSDIWPRKYPVQTAKAAYHRQQLKSYDVAIEGLQKKLEELKKKFIEQDVV